MIQAFYEPISTNYESEKLLVKFLCSKNIWSDKKRKYK